MTQRVRHEHLEFDTWGRIRVRHSSLSKKFATKKYAYSSSQFSLIKLV